MNNAGYKQEIAQAQCPHALTTPDPSIFAPKSIQAAHLCCRAMQRSLPKDLLPPAGFLRVGRTAEQLCNLPGAPRAGAPEHRADSAVDSSWCIHDACLGAAAPGCSYPCGCEGHGPIHHPDCTCPSPRRCFFSSTPATSTAVLGMESRQQSTVRCPKRHAWVRGPVLTGA